MSKNDYGDRKSPQDTLTTAYGLVKQIKQDIESIDLEEHYTGVRVDLEASASHIDINYGIEATDVYSELDHTPETTYFENSGKIVPKTGIPLADEEVITEALEEDLDSALMVNGEVVNELLSPDYEAF